MNLNDIHFLDLIGLTGDPDCSLQPLARLDRPEDEPKRLRSVAITKDDIDEWIGLRENLQESIDFPIKYGVFL
jgi:hypothetical protein